MCDGSSPGAGRSLKAEVARFKSMQDETGSVVSEGSTMSTNSVDIDKMKGELAQLQATPCTSPAHPHHTVQQEAERCRIRACRNS